MKIKIPPIIFFLLIFSAATFNATCQKHGNIIISEHPDFDCAAYFAERDTIDEMFGMFFDEPPKIVGGVDTIQHLLKYPEGMEMYRISGNAYASILIDTTSEILCYKIFTGLSEEFIFEVIRVLDKLEFKTGTIRGKPLRIDMVLPFSFYYDREQGKEIEKKKQRRGSKK